MVSETVVTIWTYTGFALIVALAWVLIGFLAWLGAQLFMAAWHRTRTYRWVIGFFKNNKECHEKFQAYVLNLHDKQERDGRDRG